MRPAIVEQARARGDTGALRRMGRNGGLAAAKRNWERSILAEIVNIEREEGMRQAAFERGDHLIPENDR